MEKEVNDLLEYYEIETDKEESWIIRQKIIRIEHDLTILKDCLTSTSDIKAKRKIGDLWYRISLKRNKIEKILAKGIDLKLLILGEIDKKLEPLLIPLINNHCIDLKVYNSATHELILKLNNGKDLILILKDAKGELVELKTYLRSTKLTPLDKYLLVFSIYSINKGVSNDFADLIIFTSPDYPIHKSYEKYKKELKQKEGVN
jgi:hypothetical protein